MSHSQEQNFIKNIGKRLGLEDEITVLKKAHELFRVLSTKVGIKKIGDFAKAVICLDLSSRFIGIGFDKECALKLSGLKESAYQNNLNMVEKLLQLDKPLTIKEVCVQHSCTVIKDLAEEIIEAYGKHNKHADMSHPQYVSVSVYSACKLKSIKVQKSSFVRISHLKPMQWKELEAEFTKFVETLNLNNKIKKKSSKNDLHEFLEEHASTNESKKISPQKKVVESIEDYDIWKARIIAAAKQAILQA